MNLRWTVPILLLVLLAACSKPSCLHEQSYQSAEVFPKLTAPPGMSVPTPDPNLAIPQVADGPVAYTKEPDPESKFGVRCLDVPPRMPASKPGL